MRCCCVFSVLIVSVLLLAGCTGSNSVETRTVSGTVTFDGTPIAEGNIVFRDAAGQVRSCGGSITNGQYSFEASPGKKKVEITAIREVPGKFDTSNPGEKVPLMESYIPANYNENTGLTAEVTGSDEPINFTLEAVE